MDCSLPSSSLHGILQVRVLEWVAISFSKGSSRPRDRTRVSHIAGRRLTSEPPGKPKIRIDCNKKKYSEKKSEKELLKFKDMISEICFQSTEGLEDDIEKISQSTEHKNKEM